MKNIYLLFHERGERKIHQDIIGDIDLASYPFLTFEDPNYVLKEDILIGQLDHKETFAFLRQEGRDIYLEFDALGDAMHDDIVLVEMKYEPRVVDVVYRALKRLIATVKKNKKGSLIFKPDVHLNRQLNVKPFDGLVSGHVVTLTVNKIDALGVYANVEKIVGHTNDPDINTLKIVYSYDWPTQFRQETIDNLKDVKLDFEAEKKTRLDLTSELIITIDGADAKDLDDAISLEVKDEHYHLGVHIADVASYVLKDSPLDLEAYERATSSYLADRVIPMLPHLLSNDYCSLNPHEPKLTLSCLMILDQNAHVVSYEIKKTLIESKRRMTYLEVNQYLLQNKELGSPKIEKMLDAFHELSLKLKKVRHQRGEIEFESSELGFKVDEEGRVLDVYERNTDVAEQLIESMMLIANETVAYHMSTNNLPSIYRIHEKPDLDKLKTALQTVSKLGFSPNFKQLGSAKPLQILAKNSSGTPYGYIVHMLLLRSMQKAKYSEKREIHFGLGATYYTHFTSPIRRYPDLILHRLIHTFVTNKETPAKQEFGYYQARMPEIAKHTSDQERKAVQMERDVAKLKSCEFMEPQIGKHFSATITQMMPSGMFIKLSNGIEGFVPLRRMNDYYRLNEETLTYVGSRGKKYRLGDAIKVELVSVDVANKKMDYLIIDKQARNRKRK